MHTSLRTRRQQPTAWPIPLTTSWRRLAFHMKTFMLSQAVANLCGFLGWNAEERWGQARSTVWGDVEKGAQGGLRQGAGIVPAEVTVRAMRPSPRPSTSEVWPCVSGSGVSRLSSQISHLSYWAQRAVVKFTRFTHSMLHHCTRRHAQLPTHMPRGSVTSACHLTAAIR